MTDVNDVSGVAANAGVVPSPVTTAATLKTKRAKSVRAAIEIEDVSKRFRLYREKLTSLKERAIRFGKIPYEDFWALKNVSFEIKEGETVGLLGHNGSGKSTLLKCIAGIQPPTSGLIRSRGRMAAMLELGAGFHPDLTGRENVYLNASLLGLSRSFVDKKFDEIVAFAELEQFIDNQVKFYSSGMYVRLGFAVAVNMDPDILLVDEVLAVGDELFQKKCLDRVRRFQREGRTIVVVTHSVDMVRSICDRAAVFDKGELVAYSEPVAAARTYREHLYARYGTTEGEVVGLDAVEVVGPPVEVLEEPLTVGGSLGDAGSQNAVEGEDDAIPVELTQEEKANHKIKLSKVTFSYEHSEERKYLLPDESLKVHCRYTVNEPVDDVVFGIAINDLDGHNIFGINTFLLGIDLGTLPVGEGRLTFNLDRLPLLDGEYFVTIGVHNAEGFVVYDWHDQRYRFQVSNPNPSVGIVHIPLRVTGTAGVAATVDAKLMPVVGAGQESTPGSDEHLLGSAL